MVEVPTQFYSIDPGEEHVGVAHFRKEADGWHVAWARTYTPNDAVDMMLPFIERGLPGAVICEQWRVYPGMSEWSECLTAEIIGVMRHACRRKNIPFDTVPARMKKPAEAFTRRASVTLIGDTVHARDAELIGWFFVRPEG